MQFNKYLKSCRENFNFTQEQLVQELFNSDDMFFTLDTNTLSRWERGVTQPSSDKKLKIIHLFGGLGDTILPCFNKVDSDDIENMLCRLAVKNLIGSSKEHILNFPSKSFRVDDIAIKHLINLDDIDNALKISHSVIDNLTGSSYGYGVEDIKKWASHPSNLFLHCEYLGQFYGLLFVFRLKTEVFKKVIEFEIELKDIISDDFASFDEVGASLPISFFAYNEKSSSLLILRYYAHLIANQALISDVGVISLLDGAKKIVTRMNMKHHKDKKIGNRNLSSHQAPLSKVLINESVLKMLFNRDECPKEHL